MFRQKDIMIERLLSDIDKLEFRLERCLKHRRKAYRRLRVVKARVQEVEKVLQYCNDVMGCMRSYMNNYHNDIGLEMSIKSVQDKIKALRE